MLPGTSSSPAGPPQPGGPTGAVSRQQGVAVEARGAGLAVGPGGVVQAGAAGARQGVAVVEEQVGVPVAAAVAGLARAAQHQRVPEEAGGAPGARAGSAAHCAAPCPAPTSWAPPPPGSPLAGGSRVARFAQTLRAAPREDAAHREAAETEVAVTRPHTPRERPSFPDWAGLQGSGTTPASPPPPRPSWRTAGSTGPAYLLEGTETGQGQLTQGAAGSSDAPRTKPAWQRSQWSPSVLCWQPWGAGPVGTEDRTSSSRPRRPGPPALCPAASPRLRASVTADPQVPGGCHAGCPPSARVHSPRRCPCQGRRGLSGRGTDRGHSGPKRAL